MTKTLLVIPLLFALACAGASAAADAPAALIPKYSCLKGVSSVFVYVYLDKSLRDVGVEQSALQTSVEVKLRGLGMTVYNISSVSMGTSTVDLIIAIGAVKPQTVELYCYSISTQMTDAVILPRQPRKVFYAPTWQDSDYGCAGKDVIVQSVKDAFDKETNNFANDYLTANPKPSPIPSTTP